MADESAPNDTNKINWTQILIALIGVLGTALTAYITGVFDHKPEKNIKTDSNVVDRRSKPVNSFTVSESNKMLSANAPQLSTKSVFCDTLNYIIAQSYKDYDWLKIEGREDGIGKMTYHSKLTLLNSVTIIGEQESQYRLYTRILTVDGSSQSEKMFNNIMKKFEACLIGYNSIDNTANLTDPNIKDLVIFTFGNSRVTVGRRVSPKDDTDIIDIAIDNMHKSSK